MKNALRSFGAAILISITIPSCTEQKETEVSKVKGYQIDVKIANTSMDSAFLFELGENGWNLKQSVAGDSGKFHFEGNIEGANYIAIGDKKRNYAIRLMANNSAISITGDFEKPGEELITGSSVHDELLATKDSMSVFSNYMDELITKHHAAEDMDDTVTMSAIETEFYLYEELKDKWLREWVKNNPKSYVAQFYLINPLSYQLSTEELRIYFDEIDASVNNSLMYATLSNKLATLEQSAVGQIAPDFTMNDTLDKPITLSGQFGNYLLLDFWASWCGPCRMENPHMVEIYNKYHGQGYDVLGVSLDRDRDKWLAAIKKDQLTWNHVTDLGFWNNAAAKLYLSLIHI